MTRVQDEFPRQERSDVAVPSGEGAATIAGTGDSESQTRSGAAPDLTHATGSRAANDGPALMVTLTQTTIRALRGMRPSQIPNNSRAWAELQRAFEAWEDILDD